MTLKLDRATGNTFCSSATGGWDSANGCAAALEPRSDSARQRTYFCGKTATCFRKTRKCSAPVAPCKRFAHVSVQVGLRKVLCASALCKCSVQFAAIFSTDVVRGAHSRAPAGQSQLLSTNAVRGAHPRSSGSTCAEQLAQSHLHRAPIFQPELQEHAPRTTFVLQRVRRD